jgi:glycosyltransferase involved in cell wall biosynthesis
VDDFRLALVSDAVKPFHDGGKETRHDEIIRRLSRSGVDVEVHTMHWWDGDRNRAIDIGGIRYRALCRLYPMYRQDRRDLRQAVVFALSGFRMLFRRFDAVEVDAVPVAQIFTLRIVTWLRRRPLVVTWHEVWGAPYWRQYLGRLGVIAAFLERRAIGLPDHIISPSRATAERLRELSGGRARVSVVPNGINLGEIQRIQPSTTSVDVIFVGRLIKHKNVDVLIRAVARLRDRSTPVRCAIIGTGPEHDNLRELTARLRLDDLVSFEGRIERNHDVVAAMKSARVFCSLSEREGFGIAVLEAMASGLPVVAYDHPDNHACELLEDTVNGRLVRTLDEEEVAGVIADTLSDIDGMKDGAVQSAQGFEWDRIAERMREVYTS